MTRIVCDTGPLLHLREADLLPLLEVAGEIRVPPAVRREAASRHAGGPYRYGSPSFRSVPLHWRVPFSGNAPACSIPEKRRPWL